MAAITGRGLAEIVARSATLYDRLNGGSMSGRAADDEGVLDARTRRWCEVVAGGDPLVFQQRLAWDGVSTDTLTSVLGSFDVSSGHRLPQWADILPELLETSLNVGDRHPTASVCTGRFLDPDNPLPFEDVLAPWVTCASRQVEEVRGRAGLLEDGAYGKLERSLLQRLVAISSQTLELEFSVSRAHALSPIERLLRGESPDLRRELYSGFIEHLRSGGIIALLAEYAALTRLLATVTAHWIASTREFLDRLGRDMASIGEAFNDGVEPGKGVDITPSLSDFHRNGRAVCVVRFESGLRVVYKPKPLALDREYARLLRWLNGRGLEIAPRHIETLDMGTYGWVEFVEVQPCDDLEGACRYYRRSGMLLAILYLLGATDFHAENVIASGDCPVLIDLETLLSHQVRIELTSEDQEGVHYQAQRRIDDSVIRTGFLPRWQIGEHGHAYDVSGLGSIEKQDTPYRIPEWHHVNSDQMVVATQLAQFWPRSNAPILRGEPVSPNVHLDAIVQGFRQAYGVLIAHRDELLADDGPLSGFAHRSVRVIMRHTRLYSSLLKNALHPNRLRDGIDRSIELDALAKAMLPRETRPAYWPLMRSEHHALERMDVPYFTADSSLTDLHLEDGSVLPAFFAESAYDRMVARLRNLDVDDLAFQVSIIRGSLHARTADASHNPIRAARDAGVEEWPAALGPEEKLSRAVEIAEELRRLAFWSQKGGATWVGLEYVYQGQRFQLKPMGLSLYSGCTGIALFLLALDHVAGRSDYRELAWGALHEVRNVLGDARTRGLVAKTFGIGGGKGLGSIIYGLVQISQLTSENMALDYGRRAVELLSIGAIHEDAGFDIIDGAAGALLGLLAFHRVRPDPETLEKAVACGQHLLDNRILSKTGHRVWKTRAGEGLTGFSHGAAGIAYSLLRLTERTGDTTFERAAREAIAYEQSIFCPVACNWPDLREGVAKDHEKVFMTSWCNGAPGIGLARLGGLPIADSPAIRRDIEAACEATMAYGPQDVDSLCCGNCGRIDFLLEAARRLSSPDLQAHAERIAAWIARRAGKPASFFLARNLPLGVPIPGLYQGTPGVGYTLLRLAYPDMLPCITLFE